MVSGDHKRCNRTRKGVSCSRIDILFPVIQSIQVKSSNDGCFVSRPSSFSLSCNKSGRENPERNEAKKQDLLLIQLKVLSLRSALKRCLCFGHVLYSSSVVKPQGPSSSTVTLSSKFTWNLGKNLSLTMRGPGRGPV